MPGFTREIRGFTREIQDLPTKICIVRSKPFCVVGRKQKGSDSLGQFCFSVDQRFEFLDPHAVHFPGSVTKQFSVSKLFDRVGRNLDKKNRYLTGYGRFLPFDQYPELKHV